MLTLLLLINIKKNSKKGGISNEKNYSGCFVRNIIAYSRFSAAACTPNEIQVDKLVVYNWADYIYDSKLTDFKEYYKSLTATI